MITDKFHTYSSDVANEVLPKAFTNPFDYTPHKLTVSAVQEVQAYIASRTDWAEELRHGKMFGVLVVKDFHSGEVGFLAAFSGNLCGENTHDYFVPPICDLLNPSGYFKQEEARISRINREIESKEQSPDFLDIKQQLHTLQEQQTTLYREAEQHYKISKAERDAKRKQGLTPEETLALERESQYMKAELRRTKLAHKTEREAIEKQLQTYLNEIERLKQERKTRSADLQHYLFTAYRLLNARGETKNLLDVFAQTAQRIPPGGAGECALPKLLQYAYEHHLQPICMGEFWWGQSPKEVIRHHGVFYPSCTSKCKPILAHMLQGLNVEENRRVHTESLRILYEDAYLVAISKPAGVLSVAGREEQTSVTDLLPDMGTLYAVHRLDMDTSGILLLAKNKEIYRLLQADFSLRKIVKRYRAILEGLLSVDEGEIALPLSPNYMERPRQQVDFLHGKPALTFYKVVKREKGYTWVDFYPHTGRTHQLRVHAAHAEGLACPILGDRLYGTQTARRMFLHAEELKFRHPMTKKLIHLTDEADF